jgi:GNAT superfamily N-acetyltransferase
MRIRSARSADIEAMHALRLRVRENSLSDPGRVTEESYGPYVAAGSAWLAETERGLGGFAVLDPAGASVWALFVAPEAEGRGIGGALLDRLLAEARARGLRRLSLQTDPGTRAERFYTAAGWTKAGTSTTGELSFEKEVGE